MLIIHDFNVLRMWNASLSSFGDVKKFNKYQSSQTHTGGTGGSTSTITASLHLISTFFLLFISLLWNLEREYNVAYHISLVVYFPCLVISLSVDSAQSDPDEIKLHAYYNYSHVNQLLSLSFIIQIELARQRYPDTINCIFS